MRRACIGFVTILLLGVSDETMSVAGEIMAASVGGPGGRVPSGSLGWVTVGSPLARFRQAASAARCPARNPGLAPSMSSQRHPRDPEHSLEGAEESELPPRTLSWLMQRTKGRAAQFDVILQTSKERINLKAEMLEVKKQLSELQRSSSGVKQLQEEADNLRNTVGALKMQIEARNLMEKEAHVAPDAVGICLDEDLRRMEVKLAEVEEVVRAHTHAAMALSVRETALAADAIRIELETERARQLLKLRALVSTFSEPQSSPHSCKAHTHSADPSPAREFLADSLSLDCRAVEALCDGVRGLCGFSVTDRLEPLVSALRSSAHVPPKRLGKMISRWPGVLALKGEDVMRISAFLEHELKLPAERIGWLVVHHPWLLAQDVEIDLRPVMDILCERTGVSPQEVGSMVLGQARVAQVGAESIGKVIDILEGESGLVGKKLGMLLVSWPRILLLDPAKTLQPMIKFLLEEVGLSADALAKVVTSNPQVLTMDLEEGMRATYRWLLELGVPKGKVERVVRSHPKALGYRVDGKLTDLSTFLLSDLDLPNDKAGIVITKFPQLLGLSVEDNLKPTVEFLVQEVLVPREGLGKLVTAFPQVLGLSVDMTLRPHLNFMKDELNIPAEKLGKVVLSFPHLLAYCLDTNLRPTIDFLHNEIGVPRENMGKIVANHPQILGYSVSSKLMPTVEYLVSEVGVPESCIPLLVERCPKLLGCSVSKNLRPTMSFFEEELNLDQERLSNIVMKYPALLGLSIDKNLRPKIEYLETEVGVDRDELQKILGSCPQLLAYSLEKRIKPRHRLLEGKGLKLGLHSMLTPSDLTFYHRYGEGLASMAAIYSACDKAPESGKFYWHGTAAVPVQPQPRKPRKKRATSTSADQKKRPVRASARSTSTKRGGALLRQTSREMELVTQ